MAAWNADNNLTDCEEINSFPSIFFFRSFLINVLSLLYIQRLPVILGQDGQIPASGLRGH
jgi:hypothetical protein